MNDDTIEFEDGSSMSRTALLNAAIQGDETAAGYVATLYEQGEPGIVAYVDAVSGEEVDDAPSREPRQSKTYTGPDGLDNAIDDFLTDQRVERARKLVAEHSS